MSQSREQAESFLARWSRRKRGKQPQEHGQQSAAPDAPAREPQAGPSATAEATAPQDAPLPEDLRDFSPETLDVDSADFSRFLKEDVPEHIRRAALRKLWESDETLANLDGLNDYDEDFTPAGVLQAARDFLGRVADTTQEKSAQALAREESTQPPRRAESARKEAEGENPTGHPASPREAGAPPGPAPDNGGDASGE